MDQVKWKISGIFKADAQKVYEEIGDDPITAEELLDKAKDEKTELHKCFTWNDTEAAHRWRLQQATTILRSLVIVPKNEEVIPQRVFQISSEINVYMPTREILRNDDEYKVLLARATSELRAIRNRYKSIAELEEVFTAIDSL